MYLFLLTFKKSFQADSEIVTNKTTELRRQFEYEFRQKVIKPKELRQLAQLIFRLKTVLRLP